MDRAQTGPPAEAIHPPNLLGPLMLLTVTTGIIDAVSFVGLGRVFTANMTGNVVFIGFALAGAEGLSVERSLVALATFAAGALVGGRLVNRRAGTERLFVIAAATEAAFAAIAAVVGLGRPMPPSWYTVHALIVLTAIAMGFRNAVVRGLGVPDVTTTVLTLTITGLAADSPLAGGTGARSGRKTLSIAAMLIGALIGTLLLNTWGFAAPLALVSVMAAVASVMVALPCSRQAPGGV